ncbi:hypothetical protein CWE12_06785 [Aliidiomarina sedimenti]|uniref:DUF2383 domain-containing protein n=1 Tax=Aliidiomarina sedimenti TaxID=1933879 RepID=A0ABY0C0L8_9GAMM|nr:hypothetical protein [Aliidiomarina sedimenti]RUO30938.1 hypothetical protein CWE12_06785 [Aliidiomarina sedimenti]
MPLNDIYALSKAGCSFYRFATHHVDDYNIRRIFQQRFEIHQQLQEVVAQYGSHPDSNKEDRIQACSDWFETAQRSIQVFDNFIFLDLLEAQERLTLDILKRDVKKSTDEQLSHCLAQLAAYLQISRDQLAALKEQYRVQHQLTPSAP